MFRRLRLLVPAVLFGLVILAATPLAAFATDPPTVGLYTTNCTGGGYSYFRTGYTEGGTYELYNNANCYRMLNHIYFNGSWHSQHIEGYYNSYFAVNSTACSGDHWLESVYGHTDCG